MTIKELKHIIENFDDENEVEVSIEQFPCSQYGYDSGIFTIKEVVQIYDMVTIHV